MPRRHFAQIARILACNASVATLVWAGHVLPDIEAATMVLVLVLAVLFIAIRVGRVESITASVVAAVHFGYWFVEPIGAFAIHSVDGLIAIAGLLMTAIVVSQLALRADRTAREAIERQRETERLYELGQSLMLSDRMETIAYTVSNQILPVFGARGAAVYVLESGLAHRAGEAELLALEELRRAARARAFESGDGFVIIPLTRGGEAFGSLGIVGAEISETALRALSHMISVMLERIRMSESLARTNDELARQNREVEQQKHLSESLLLNILPEEVAAELRTNGMVAPKYFEDVTILFTDFVGFTVSTEHLAAEDVVHVLHDYFTAFDKICARYGIEKLKTIGDSYMCIAGLPTRTPSHPVDAVMAAFEMIHEVERRASAGSLAGWKVRIGIHTGPVVAGVVGIDKFAFDIWGDTVNYSSRMESSGAPNRINISERTYARVKDFFECEYRGKVLTKEKRDVDMYFVNRPQPRLLEGPGAIPEAFARRYDVYFQKSAPAFPQFLLAGAPELIPSGRWCVLNEDALF